MQVILSTVGTVGDVLPFVAIGHELKRRGYGTILMTSSDHEALARGSGVEFIAVGDPDWPQVGRNDSAFFKHHLIPVYYKLEREIKKLKEIHREVVAITRFGNFGALFSCERHEIPFVNIMLQPASLHIGGHPISATDLALLNAFRTDIGLVPINGCRIKEPSRATFSLFPGWFAGDSDRLKVAGACVGFPFGVCGMDDIPVEVIDFIHENGRPAVVTLGTGVQETGRFYDAALDLSLRAELPVIFLSKYRRRGFVKRNFLVWDSIDHAKLLQVSRVVVHNGGIGVTAQAIRAGIPQVVMPIMYDQPDNASLVKMHGLGEVVNMPALGGKELLRAVDVALRLPRAPITSAARNVRADQAIVNMVRKALVALGLEADVNRQRTIT